MTPSPTAAIVVGVEGSAQGMHAVDWAAREAVARRCPFAYRSRLPVAAAERTDRTAAGGPPDAGLANVAEDILADATDRTRRAAPALEISTDLPACSPAAALIEASHDAGLVVVGHRG
jgi:nucleotide-binding universal stress UspA family protein